MKKTTIYLLLFSLSSLGLRAQSVHYSQYNDFVSTLNPATVAVNPEYDYVAGVLYRSQWRNLPAPYQTFAVNGDFSIYLGDKYSNGWFGGGVSLINDVAGDGKQKNNRIQTSIAYHQRLNDNNIISVGFTGGYNSMSLDFDQLTYSEQWDGGKYNPVLPNGETVNSSALSFLYINSGVNYYHLRENFSLRVGYALHNINRPTPSYLNTYSPTAFRHLITTEATIQAGDQIIFKPLLNISMQAKAREILFGTGMYYNMGIKKTARNVLFTGINFRLGDAITPYFGYEENTWKLIVSYDATVSGLAAHQAKGALEAGLIIHSNYPRGNPAKKRLVCPRF